MYTELEIEYKYAEELVESEISPLMDLELYIKQCKHSLKNPLIWANTELIERLEASIIAAEHRLTDKMNKKVY